MTRSKEVTQAIRQQIIALSINTSKSHREIGRDLSLPNNTVSRIIKLHQETGSTTPRQRSGRPRATTTTADRALRREVLKKPFITAAKLKRTMAPMLDSVSVRTIQHRLQKDMHMPARKPVRKPFVTPKMRKSRLEFCRKHKDWTVEQWKSVLFSDESTFKQFDCLPQVVRRPPGSSPLDPKFTAKTVKHSPGVMAWGCFSYRGRGGLSFLEKGKKMNSDEYIKILDEKVIDSMRRHNCTTFQQDKAPCHTSKRTMAWFVNNDIQVLSWPGNSPDLNPIENLWLIVKKKINYDACKSLDSLKQEVTRVWCMEVTPEVCANLIESMPRRITQVIKNKGYPTKY
jgi:transposase-like protein